MNPADLPRTLTTAEAAELLGVSTSLLYDLARKGEAPVEPLRLGRKILWPTAKLLDLLGLEAEAAAQVGPSPLSPHAQQRLRAPDAPRYPKPEDSSNSGGDVRWICERCRRTLTAGETPPLCADCEMGG